MGIVTSNDPALVEVCALRVLRLVINETSQKIKLSLLITLSHDQFVCIDHVNNWSTTVCNHFHSDVLDHVHPNVKFHQLQHGMLYWKPTLWIIRQIVLDRRTLLYTHMWSWQIGTTCLVMSNVSCWSANQLLSPEHTGRYSYDMCSVKANGHRQAKRKLW